jgi:hypothetical protein
MEDWLLFSNANEVAGNCSEEKDLDYGRVCRLSTINVPAHDDIVSLSHLTKKSIVQLNHRPHSSGLTPFRFLALSNKKKCLEGTKICRHFDIQRQRKDLFI